MNGVPGKIHLKPAAAAVGGETVLDAGKEPRQSTLRGDGARTDNNAATRVMTSDSESWFWGRK
jgi:hypothetical protein